MKNSLHKELIISFVLMGLLFFLLNPFSMWMPSMAQKVLVSTLVVAFFIFVSFIWREKGEDEREEMHILLADRVAFLVGTGVMVLGLAIQVYTYMINTWLVLALAAAILAKIIGLIYVKNKY